jgi:biopolymer transport protein ExbB/TolQ
MNRFAILVTMICFLFTPFRVGFSQENKEQKGEYQKRVETTLTEFKQKLQELERKSSELEQGAKGEFNEGMKELQKKEEAANKKFKELDSSGSKTWEKIKADMDSAMTDLGKQYDKMLTYSKKAY